jgi:hypothetical protein
MRYLIPVIALSLSASSIACHAQSVGAATHNYSASAMLVLAGQAGHGYKYSAPDGSYSIEFPGKPSEKSQTVQTKLGQMTVVIETYEANAGKRAFFSSSSQYKLDPRRYNVEKGLDGARDGVAKSTHATVSKETKISKGGASGRQFYLTMPQGKAKVRLYVLNAGKGPTIYQTFVIDTTGNVDDAAVNSFLDSLALKRH